jgi:chromosome partitioning protein
MVTITTANQKGGVGKTTTAVTLVHGLALRGYHTLIIDLDPQGHVALTLGLKKEPGFYRLISQGEDLEQCIVQARENLFCVLGDKRTEIAKRDLLSVNYREQVLANILAGADFDIIILDTAPSLDVLHVTALAAADWLIIPTRLDSMALDGVNEVLRSSAEIAQHSRRLLGFNIIPTFFERVTRETILQLQQLVSTFGSQVWPPIPTDTRAREAPAYGQTLWEYSPSSAAVAGYSNGSSNTGGYTQVLDRLERLMNHG